MWQPVLDRFSQLLSERLYPALFDNGEYRNFLETSGIHPPYPGDMTFLTPHQRDLLAQNARLRVHLLNMELKSLNALGPRGAEAIEITGSIHLYRLWNSLRPESELRYFWFREELLFESFRQAGGSKKDRLAWLRGKLAVAYNWSDCDRIAKMHLKPRETILAVEAFGLPKRGMEIGPHDRTVTLPGRTEADYFRDYAKYNALLPGGAPQLLLFMLPRDRVMPYW